MFFYDLLEWSCDIQIKKNRDEKEFMEIVFYGFYVNCKMYIFYGVPNSNQMEKTWDWFLFKENFVGVSWWWRRRINKVSGMVLGTIIIKSSFLWDSIENFQTF